jgi:hypothetical protein
MPGQAWSDRTAAAAPILSSGGKDSLLSFGLMRDDRRQRAATPCIPLFVNESGRHWFTALNAYRHFREKCAEHRTRVWVNSATASLQLDAPAPALHPQRFRRRLRTDEYPIRLWTVAVFLFGVLPLMRKRGIGRLLVGDEFDTTVRGPHPGNSPL